ncbi:hypothetical protein OSTOST_01065 [Ostertagia ostertagi]
MKYEKKTAIRFSDCSGFSSSKSELLVFAMKKKIFCEGSLLDAVQRSNLYSDCKHFVDMSLKHDAETTLVRWEALRAAGPVTTERLREFVNDFFNEPENELTECLPDDWDPAVRFTCTSVAFI